MIADAQALTDNADNPEKVRQNIIEVALDYLSVGLDPKRSTLFIQSQIPELCELSFYYMNLVTVQRLQRNPTVKAEIQLRGFAEGAAEGDTQQKQGIPVGFFTYPLLRRDGPDHTTTYYTNDRPYLRAGRNERRTTYVYVRTNRPYRTTYVPT